jgi:hypothetical protein
MRVVWLMTKAFSSGDLRLAAEQAKVLASTSFCRESSDAFRRLAAKLEAEADLLDNPFRMRSDTRLAVVPGR